LNIFDWAQDNNILFLENIDWWLLNNNKSLHNILRPSNGLTVKRAEKICKILFNIICINVMNELVRLIGFGDDGEDYYYITKDIKGNIVWESMVGYLIPLKGKISTSDYFRIERGFEGWSDDFGKCQKEKKFLSLYEPTNFAIKYYNARK